MEEKVPGIWVALSLAFGEGLVKCRYRVWKTIQRRFWWKFTSRLAVRGRLKRLSLREIFGRFEKKNDCIYAVRVRGKGIERVVQWCAQVRCFCEMFKEGASVERRDRLWFQRGRWLDRIQARNPSLRLTLQRPFHPSNHVDFCALVRYQERMF